MPACAHDRLTGPRGAGGRRPAVGEGGRRRQGDAEQAARLRRRQDRLRRSLSKDPIRVVWRKTDLVFARLPTLFERAGAVRAKTISPKRGTILVYLTLLIGCVTGAAAKATVRRAGLEVVMSYF